MSNAVRGLLALLTLLYACGDDVQGPRPRPDAGPKPRDAAPEDAARPVPDAAIEPDAGEDAGVDSGLDSGVDSGADKVQTDPELELTQWQPLFDATLSEWYKFLPSRGRDNDPQGVFKMEGSDTLHVLGITPPAGDQEFGYVATRSEYNNYRFQVEQRWGTQKFAPRASVVRDSGLLYHMRGNDLVWPQCVEFQIQENDIGDLFLLGDVGTTTWVDPAADTVFKEGGMQRVLRGGAITKGATYESLTDWNALELVASEREFVHAVNGKVNHRGIALEFKNGASWEPLDRGRILLQAEGAEVFYKRARLRPLAYPMPPTGAVVLFDGSNLDAFQHADGATPRWKIVDGALEIEPGGGDLVARQTFGSVRLHFEFRLPATADPSVPESARAHSRIYLGGRYPIALRDSFGRALGDATSGAVVGAPAVNEALPAEVWQSVDVVFRRKRGERNARITVVYNGSQLYKSLELTESAGDDGAGKLRFAEEGSRVRFRNIWLTPL